MAVSIEIQQYIKNSVPKLIVDADLNAFVEDALEDLEQIDESRVAGLGITQEQLYSWLTTR